MADLADLSFRIDSRPVRTATGDLRDLGEQGKRTARATDQLADAANRAPRATDRLAMSLRGVAGAAAAAYAAFASARTIYDAVEGYTRASNALRGIGLSAGQASAALDEIAGIATRTRAPLDATAQLYQRITVASRDLGASQADVSRFVENVGMALASSGTSANEASGALMQLSQAMAGGTVQAEEFNSILEGAFPIAQAAANAIDEAGGSVGRLRALVVDGKISSKEFFDAVLESTDALETAFGNTVPTISGALTNLGTAFTMTIGSMNQMLSASGGIAQAIMFLAENMDRAVVYAGTAATAFGVAYVAGMARAAVATHGLTAALKVLRGTLIRSSIFGAVVVGAGELIYQFTELVRKTGGFGSAMSALGPLAVEVWDRIKLGASAMGQGLKAVWHEMAAEFVLKLSEMAGAFADFMLDAGSKASEFGLDGMASTFRNVAAEAGIASAKLIDTVNSNREAGAAAKAAGQEMMSAAFAPLESLGALQESVDGASESLGGDGGAGGGGGLGGAADKAGKATDKLSDAAKAAKKRLDELKSAAESWTDRVATPVEKYRKELKELNVVAAAGLIGDETKARGIKALNLELADSTPLVGELVDAVTGSMFDGFRATLDSITSFFKRWLAQMIATAAKNQIVVSMGGSFGVPGAGAMGSGLMSSMGGVLGGIGSTLAGLGTTFMQNAIGIFGADMAGLSATLAGATSSLSGFAAAAGALALPIAGAVAAFDFFRSKTKKLDEGMRLTTEGMATAVESWERIRKTRFWGLSTDTDNHYSGAPSDIANPLKQAVGEMQAGIVQAADALGVGRGAFADFSHQIKLSTKGMTEEEAVRALQEELGGLGEAFAAMVPGVNRLRAAGETAADALARTATSLTTVNSAFRTLGFDRLDESLRGGRTANRLVELSGGLQQFATATQYYFDNIMSAPDRLRALTRQFNQALDAANINARPGNAGQFQRQVERMMGNGARRKATALINLAPLFTEIQRLQGELDTTGSKAGNAADRLAAREQRAADIARERAGLEAQLLRLSGDQRAIRKAELADLYPANRALQRRIWRLEQEAEAAARTSAIMDQRRGMEIEYLTLMGDTAKIRTRELHAIEPANKWLQHRIWALEDEAAAAEKAAAVAEERLGIQRQVWELTGNTAAIQKDLLASLSPANRALQQHVWSLEKQAEAAEKASAILDERRGIEGTLLDLQGNTAEIRRRELLALDPSNRALQQRIWKLEDEAAAAEKASAVADERLGIQRRIWELTGNTAAIQRDLLSALDPSNRALQQHAWSLEKQAEAAEKASAVADERTSLENRLLELQGNAAELRRRELAGLDASNRALQLMIWGLEDAAKAMEALDPADFASRLDFERARARAANGVGGVTSTGVPLAVIPQTPAQTVQTDNAALLREIRDLNKQMLGNGVEGEGHLFRMVRIIREWDRSGLPQERSA